MNNPQNTSSRSAPGVDATQEKLNRAPLNGFAAVGIMALVVLLVGFMVFSSQPVPGTMITFILTMFALVFCLKGYVVLEPNTAAVFTLFGKYAYTIRDSGFFWVNPFLSNTKVSLRIENFNTELLKVNDRAGNPIEIAAIITWKVNNAARAVFDVQNHVRYIQIQSEMGVRDVAAHHAYDSNDTDEITLRGNSDDISKLLLTMVQDHARAAGIEVIDVKIMHLAYAPEIAGVMLRRQQASAVVQARELLVEGAVGIVKTALAKLEGEGIAHFGPAERTTLVTNMMTVMLAEENAQPVIQMGKASA